MQHQYYQPERKQPVGKLKAKQHESYGTMTILCVIIPIVGLIIGVAYIVKDDPLDKKLGEHLIAFSILMGIIGAFAWMVLGVFMRASMV